MHKEETKEHNPKRLAIYIRLTKNEYNQLQKDSIATKISIPKLLKQKYFTGKGVTILMNAKDTHTALIEIKRIGNNVNQIARHLNSGFREGFDGMLAETVVHLQIIKSFIGGRDGRR